MGKFMGLKPAASETGLAEYTLRMYCKQGKIRYNKSGVKYILRIDWLMEDLEKMASSNLITESQSSDYGQLRKLCV